MTKKDIVFIVLLFLLALAGIKALFHPDFYTSHDGEHQVIRLYHFSQGLSDGQFPVRWAGTLLYHFGYPLFIFTFRLPSIIGSFFYSLGASLTDSVKIVFILSFIASGLTMFLFAKEFLKNSTAAFFSAFLYLWAPYRFLNIFVRAAIGDHLVFVFLPLVFLSIFKLRQKAKLKWVIFGSFSLAGMILSHALVTQILILPIFIFFLFLLLKTKKKRKFIIPNVLLIIFSLGLTVYYLLPAFYYKKIIVGLNPFYYSDHFPTLKQLLYSKWGYGFSFPGPNDGLSFQVGIAHWLCIGIAFLILLFLISQKKINVLAQNIFLFLLLFILSVFLMLKHSSPVYRALANIFVLDFPFRLLILSVFSSSILGGLVITFFTKNKPLLSLILTSLFFLNLYANRNHLRVNQYVHNPDEFYIGNYWTTSSSYDEYLPKSFNKAQVKENVPKIITDEKKAKVEIVKEKSNLLELAVDTQNETQLKINSLYFPGWKVFINDKQLKDFSTENGIFNLQIDPSIKKITLKFSETPIMLFADLVTLLAILLLLSVIFLCIFYPTGVRKMALSLPFSTFLKILI